MASWKKVVVSGSSAELSNLNVTNAVTASYFVGDGTGLTGITATGLDIDNFGSDLTSATIEVGDKIIVSDNGTEGRITVGQLATPLAGTGLEASSNTIRIATAAAGDGLAGGGGSALTVDSGSLLPYYSSSILSRISGVVTVNSGTGVARINPGSLSDATVDVANDSIMFMDSSDGNASARETIADLVSGIAGTNLSAASGQLSLSTTIANDHTFSNDITIQGNLTVEGDTINASVANLNVEDRFILLNSGSSTRADSGIIFGASDASLNSGSALFWDADYNSNDGRLAIGDRVAADNNADITPLYHIAGVYEGTATDAATAQADHVGNIRVESSEIYIYV